MKRSFTSFTSFTSLAGGSRGARLRGSSPSAGTTSSYTRCGGGRARHAGAQDRPPRGARVLEHLQEHGDVERARAAEGGDARARIDGVGRGRRRARPRRERAGRRPRRVLDGGARARDDASADHRRARRGRGAAEPGDRGDRPADVGRAGRSHSRTARRGVAVVLRRDRADCRARLDRRRGRIPRVALRQGDDGRRRRRRRVSQLSVHARAVRGVRGCC